MFIPDSTDNVRMVLDGINTSSMLYEVAGKHPAMIAELLQTYFNMNAAKEEERKNNLPYMKVFRAMKEYVNSNEDHPTKVKLIRDLRNAYGLTLGDASGTINAWVSKYQYNNQFGPEFFYTSKGVSFDKCEDRH